MNVHRFSGQVAAVTGGGAGIGEAICRRLSAEGAAVAVLDLSAETAQRTADSLDRGLALAVDVSDSAQVDEAVATIERELGPLEIFVNNAGAVGLDHVKRVTPRLDRPRDEVAAAVAFLASEDAAYFVGATLSPNGGLVTAV